MGLKKRGVDCDWLEFRNVKEFWRQRNLLQKQILTTSDTIFVITSPSHVLTIPFVLALHRRAILDAGWPLYDGVISSRRRFGVLGRYLFQTLFVDLIAFHLSKRVILESEEQLNWVNKHYLVPKSKLVSIFTGYIEDHSGGCLKTKDRLFEESLPLNVLFRGGNQVEAGLDILESCCVLLDEDFQISFKVISKDLPINMFRNRKIKVIREYLTNENLAHELCSADLIIGQLSNHKRLMKTLPHKFFEAAYFGVPYLSANTGVMARLVSSGIVIGTEPNNPKELSENLRELEKNRPELAAFGNEIHRWYRSYASQAVLTTEFLHIILERY